MVPEALELAKLAFAPREDGGGGGQRTSLGGGG
jgi:hypothetical protein